MRRNKSKQMIRIFATVMAIVLLATCVPMSVFGASEDFPLSDVKDVTESTAGDAGGVSVSDGDTIVTGDVIGEYVEVLSRREENIKHFALPDGTYTAIVYPNAVHRKDADGVWQDIDNDLALLSVKGTQKYATADSRVSFSKSFSQSAELMTLSENGYAISMSLLQDNNAIISTETMSLAAPVITNSVKRELPKTDVKLEDVAKVDNKSSILYNNVRANTDIEYILDGNAVKENIIVRAASNNYEYTFDLRLDGLVALLNENGSISINDAETGEAKYIIPAPYMFDANGNTSTDVEYTLIEISSGRYLLAVTADKTWINTPGRAFPVTIDPTITYSANIVDTFISFTSEGTSFAGYPELWVGYDNDTYIKMDMPGLPDGATLIDATLFVYYYYHISTGSMLVGAFEPLDDWSESVSLNTAPGYDTPAISTYVLSASASISQSNPGLAGFDVTTLAQTWYSDPSSNNGVVLAKINDSAHTNQSVILRAFESGEDCSFIAVDYAYDFPEGVYAIENDVFPDYWITVENDETLLGNYIQYEPLSYSPTTTFDRSGLFKISQKGTTSRYIIRSMLNNRLGVGIVNGEIVTKLLPASDDDVANEDTFYIEWIDNGFYFKPYSTSMYISGSDTGMAENLSLVQADNAYNNAKWHLTKYVGMNREEICIDIPNDLIAGENLVLPAYSWSTYIDCNRLEISLYPESESVATIQWQDEENISITLHDEGILRISKKICYGSVGAAQTTYVAVHNVSLLIAEGDYFIRNVGLGNYMQRYTNHIDETIMELQKFDDQNYQKWSVEYIIDGYYILVSLNSGKVLTAPTYVDCDILEETYDGSDNQKWKIVNVDNGMYNLSPKSNPDYYMSAGWGIDSLPNGRNVEMRNSQTDNKDKWNFYLLGQHTVNLEVIYDQAYISRFSNANSRIEKQIAILQEKYLREFGITIINTSLSPFYSYVDTHCSADYDELCNCVEGEPCCDSYFDNGQLILNTYHHTNITNMLLRIPLPDISSSVKIAYLGHNYCTVNNHTDEPYYGLSYPDIGLAGIMCFDSEILETLVFLHEFGHFYRVDDHYGNLVETTDQIIERTGILGYSENCIYGEKKYTDDIINNFTICDGCKYVIKSNVGLYDN